MEKRVPHCRLSVVRQLIADGRVDTTHAALSGAAQLGLTRDEVLEVVGKLTMTDFFKSMTSYTDHRIWQDVYRPMTRAGPAYVKLIVVDNVLVVSFKRL